MAVTDIAGNSRERSAWSDAVAAQVRAERARLRLTQDQVAELSGITVQTYRRIESGKRVVDSTQIARLCAAFRMRPSEFWRRVEEQMPEMVES